MAGKIEPGESPEQAIRREAGEELGLELGPLREIAAFFPSPGTCAEMIHVYYGEPIPGSPAPIAQVGNGEDLELVELTPNKAWALLDDCKLNDGKTALALTWLRGQRGNQDGE